MDNEDAKAMFKYSNYSWFINESAWLTQQFTNNTRCGINGKCQS